MNLHVVNTGYFKLDGGAMFGVVPKTLWSRTNPPDANNLCNWAMRSLLIENDGKLVLIDNGLGNKQSEKFFSHYHLHGDHSLTKSLNTLGISENAISDMFLTHLHFDHCGGGVKLDSDGGAELTFSNAKYWSNSLHWKWATVPNPRERASFLKENIMPMQESGHLNFVDESSDFDLFEVITMDGHTEKQMLPKISYKGHTIVFVADYFPR